MHDDDDDDDYDDDAADGNQSHDGVGDCCQTENSTGT